MALESEAVLKEGQLSPPAVHAGSETPGIKKDDSAGHVYYPHIDGIRAFAVLPVLLYHVLSALCPGGYAGVDVFFVISGFLITGGIIKDLQKNQFTIRNFYHRRIRRIYPAYFSLAIGVFLAGCALYYSSPLMRLGDSTVMSTVYAANYYFLNKSGDYFNPAAHRNPLLHLWSLSIEEQFYFVIPVAIALLWKIRRRLVAPALLVIGILSFAASVNAIFHDKQPNAFYILRYRAWELIAGCVLALYSTRFGEIAGSSQKETRGNVTNDELKAAGGGIPNAILSFLGLALVLFPYCFYTSSTSFPGLSAVPSVLGAVLLIHCGRTGWINGFLSWRPFVFVGKISYSLYLWHWPVTVFWRYAVYDQMHPSDYVGMIVVSFVLAILSWRLVEMPVRKSPSWTLKKSFVFVAAGTALLISVGLSCIYYQGWPALLHPTANSLNADINIQRDTETEKILGDVWRRTQKLIGRNVPKVSNEQIIMSFGGDGTFRLGLKKDPEVFLMGDSHAGSLVSGLDASLRENMRSGISFSRSAACMFDLSNKPSKAALAELAKHPTVTKVIIAQFWSQVVKSESGTIDLAQVSRGLEELAIQLRQSGKTLYIIGDYPAFSRTSSRDELIRTQIIAPRKMVPGWSGYQTEQQYETEQGAVNSVLKEVARKTGAVFVPANTVFLKDNIYSAYDEIDARKIPLYRDGHHLSQIGSLRAARFIYPFMFTDDKAVNN